MDPVTSGTRPSSSWGVSADTANMKRLVLPAAVLLGIIDLVE
jgi:hypothetical protein